jgi:hypothetical protein
MPDTVLKKRKPRMELVPGVTTVITTSCGKLKITVNFQEKKLYEIIASKSKSGTCLRAQVESLSRLISLAIQVGGDPKEIISTLKGIRCDKPFFGNGTSFHSCSDAIAQTLEAIIESQEPVIDKPKDDIKEGEIVEKPTA